MDDFTRHTWIYPLHLKPEVATICLQFHRMIERKFGTKVKCFQSNWGGEFRKLQPIHTNKIVKLKRNTVVFWRLNLHYLLKPLWT